MVNQQNITNGRKENGSSQNYHNISLNNNTSNDINTIKTINIRQTWRIDQHVNFHSRKTSTDINQKNMIVNFNLHHQQLQHQLPHGHRDHHRTQHQFNDQTYGKSLQLKKKLQIL